MENFPCRLDESDDCYYARDYISEGGYQASEANDLITNFKKSPEKKGRPEWKYKEKAIKRFATEIAYIPNIEEFYVTCIPSSKAKGDPNYDSRLEDTVRYLKQIKPGVEIGFPFSIKKSMTAAHYGGSRDVDQIYSNLLWSHIKSKKSNIVLIDDVLTTGAHFKACKKLILEKIPKANVIGLFWARTVWPDEP